MSCDHQFFRSSESPYVSSVEITSPGSGYTWAKAHTFGGGGKSCRLRVVLNPNGTGNSIVVLFGGYKFTSVPDIVILGDGTGMEAEATVTGSAVYENTTKVQDWHKKECDGYSCKFDDADPPNELPPEERPDECLITPEPIPICGGGIDACDCGEFNPPILENTYELKDPPQFVDYSQCVKRGFKVAFAKKEWFGFYAFCDEAPSQTKYLTKTQSFIYDAGSSITGSEETPVTDIASGEVVEHINRYTGQTTITRSVNIHKTDGSTITDPDDPEADNFFRDLIGDPPCPLPTEDDYSETRNEETDTLCAYEETTYGSLSWTHTLWHNPEAEYPECLPGAIYIATTELSEPYTPSDVIEDCKALLAQIDLCNDAQIPWRTDIPIHSNSPAGHYEKQEGPAFGPVVSWVADADGNPVMRGVPNPAGYEPFFDSLHTNLEYGDCNGEGRFAWLEQTRGAWCPTKYGTATQWSSDFIENMLLPGSYASFNSSPREYQVCSGTQVLDGGTLWLSKWAEIYLSEFPHHNAARPCGETDRSTRDPDTIECDEESPEYNPEGDLRWPDAPCFCNDPSQTSGCETQTNPDLVNPNNTTEKQGSYSVKSWSYRGATLQGMTCGSGKITSPCGRAIFIQDEEPSGSYKGCLKISPPSISFFDERRVGGDGQPMGDWALVQFHQAMVDPLWKRPATCVEGVKIEDENAFVPYEENTDCEDVDCEASPDDHRCQPGVPLPWDWAEQDI